MSLNIKNERVHALAREAARRSGASQTSAIETALTRYLESLEEPRRDQRRRQRVDAVLAEFDARLSDDDRVAMRRDLAELYDDSGLPR